MAVIQQAQKRVNRVTIAKLPEISRGPLTNLLAGVVEGADQDVAAQAEPREIDFLESLSMAGHDLSYSAS